MEPDALKPMSQDEMNGLKLTPNAVAPGTFQEQMKGMDRGRATTGPATMPSTSQPSLVVPQGDATKSSAIEPKLPGGK
jgi:hypothetical protein